MEVSCEKCLIFVGLGPTEVSQITVMKYGLLSFALDSHKISSTKTMTKRTSKRLEGRYLYRSTQKLAVGEKVAYVQNTHTRSAQSPSNLVIVRPPVQLS
jgi:hypothetical protein